MVQVHDLEALAAARRACRSGEARRIRERAGLSQDEIAGPIGVSGGAVGRWERGQRMPRGRPGLRYARLLARLAAAAEVRP